MAKKKLSDYQKARRQFVQQRAAAKGGDVTKEQKQQFRQRFDVLASTKQGRTQLAQRALPNAPQEDRAAYKRVLATELPARNMGGGGSGSGGGSGGGDGGPKTKAPSYGDYASALSAAQSKIPKKSPASQGPVVKMNNINPRGGVGSRQYGPKYSPSKSNVQKAQDLWSNRRNNFIGKGIDYPGRSALEGINSPIGKIGITNPLGGSGPITDWSPKGLAKEIGKELGEAVLVAGPMARGTATVLGGTKMALQYGVKKFGQTFFQQAANQKTATSSTPKPSGTKTPGRKLPSTKTTDTKTSSTKTSSTKTSGTKTSSTKTSGTKTSGTKTSGTKTPGRKLPSTKTSSTTTGGTKAGGTKAGGTKAGGTKATSTKSPKLPKEATEDLAYELAQVKNRFPGATEKDLGFVQQLNRAQTAIEKNAPGSQAYAKWIQNKSTQATLRRLRGK